MKNNTLLTLLLTLCSCVPETTPFRMYESLSFDVSLAPVPATRSQDGQTLPITLPDGRKEEIEAFHRPMTVGQTFPDDSLSTRGAPVQSMYGSFSFLSDEGLQGTAVAGGDGRFRVGGIQYHSLPKDEGNRFWCWAPSEGGGITLEESGKLHYRTPSDITRQPDLVVAVSPGMGRLDKGPTPLVFNHALAGLQVKAGTVFPGCTVNSLTLNGVVSEGIYSLRDGTWALGSTVSDYTLIPGKITSVSAGKPLSDGDYTAMLIPQTLPDEASVTLGLTVNSQQVKLTAPLGGITLEAGCILTLGIDCRGLFLFEGTAKGNFSVYYFKGVANGTSFYKICDVPVEEDGSFSVLVPELGSSQLHSYAFARNAQLLTVTRLPGILATRTSYRRMFQNCTALKGIYCEIPHGRVTSWSLAFYNCTSLKDLPEVIHTENATEFDSMFSGCKSLATVPWMDTSSGTSFTSMFYGCTSMTTFPDYDLRKGVIFKTMFCGCKGLTELPAYQMPKGTNFTEFCKGCTSLRSIPLLDTSAGTNFSGAFANCTSLTEVSLIDTGKGTNFQGMFEGCTSLQTIPLLNTARGTTFRDMFNGCTSLTSLPLLDTSKGTSFHSMFQGCKTLTACPELDTSSGTVFTGMFRDCTALQETWPYATSRGTTFEHMFNGCTRLSRVDCFDVASGTDFRHMFFNCISLTEVPCFNFTRNSSNSHMFDGCSSLRTVPDWNWSAMTSCYHMFSGCTSLTEIPTHVATSSCTDFTQMFYGCTQLRRVASMDVGKMISGASLFDGCTSLEESPALSAPDATAISQMFNGCIKLSLVRELSFPKGESWYAVFRKCHSLKTLPEIDFSTATSLSNCFQCLYDHGSLVSLPAIDARSLTAATEVLSGQTKLKDFGGFHGISISFSLDDCISLTHESLLNVIDGLATVTSERTLNLGAANLAKLTEEELRTATDKGWTVR